MYTILVADDEAIIREGIKVLFDYAALGFSICGEAADGDQALAQIQALQPDVVLMDIRMPGLTGLEVIRQARAQGYRGKVIIVSSYSDFKYAQEAIRQGVQYYITKPIDEEELEQVLRDFKTAFDRERSARNASEHYRQKARSTIVKELLLGTGALPPQAAAEIGLLADRYQAVILEKYSQAQPEELPDFASLLRVNNQEGRFFEATVLEGAQVLLLKGEAAGQRFRALLERFQHEKSAPHRELPGNCFLCCGEPVTRLQDICLSYCQALRAQSRRFFCQQEQHVLPYSALPPEDTIHPVLTRELPGEYTQQLLRYIQSFNRNMLAQTLKELQEQLTHSSDSEEAIKLFFTDLHLQVKEQMRRLYPGSDIPFYSNAQLIRCIDQASYLYEITRFLVQRFEVMMSSIGSSNRDSVLDDILHYIDHNYPENITLESIAPLFGYNHSYLGKIFTKKMGQSFNSYVDHVRIEQAKRLLLRDDSKVYAIAQQVGYKNVDYFHLKFKKYVGQSPAEFRKQNRA